VDREKFALTASRPHINEERVSFFGEGSHANDGRSDPRHLNALIRDPRGWTTCVLPPPADPHVGTSVYT
jgi:hypothetical protein